MCRRGADGADLRPAIEVQPLAPHGNELTVSADPEIVAELDGSIEKRAWIGPPGELHHFWDISCLQGNCLRFVDAVYVLPKHLHDVELATRLPSLRHVDTGMNE